MQLALSAEGYYEPARLIKSRAHNQKFKHGQKKRHRDRRLRSNDVSKHLSDLSSVSHLSLS